MASSISLGVRLTSYDRLFEGIPLQRVVFTLATESAFGPRGDYASDLRGALGKVLFDTKAYDDVFAPVLRPGDEPAGLAGGSDAPRPFALRPPHPTSLPDGGGTVEVTVHIFNRTTAAVDLWTDAMHRAAADGFGRHRTRFDIVDRVVDRAPTLARHVRRRWAEITGDEGTAEARLRVRTATPVRILSHKRLLVPSPPTLVNATLRRAMALGTLYGEWSGYLDFAPWIEDAMGVEAAPDYDELFRATSGDRPSASQRKRIPLDGAAGRFHATVGRDLAGLMLAAEALHVGKATTTGMGWVQVSGEPRGRAHGGARRR